MTPTSGLLVGLAAVWACGLSVLGARGSADRPVGDKPVAADVAQPIARLGLHALMHTPMSLTADGRFIAFETDVALLSGDSNAESDVYILDRLTNRMTLESEASDGGPADGASVAPRVSGDGRWLLFESSAQNLVHDGIGREVDLFLRDRATRTTRRLIALARTPGRDRLGYDAVINGDGRVVAFTAVSSAAAALHVHDPDTPGSDVLVVNVETGTIVRANVTAGGEWSPTGSAVSPSLSADGRLVAFTSSVALGGHAGMLPHPQVYVRDLGQSVARLVSGTPDGRPGNDASYSASISADGRMVAFVSQASDLGIDDDNHLADIYVRDLTNNALTLVTRTARGKSANGASAHPTLSADGRFVAFVTEASDLGCARHCAPAALDNNLLPDVYLADLQTGTIQRLSGGPDGVWWRPSGVPAIDGHGRVILFPSKEPISAYDLADDYDLFAWVRDAAGR